MRSSKPKPVTVRKPRVLWANSYCLLDTSSGASISVREMLLQLAVNGYEVAVLGATVFDSEKGLSKLPSNPPVNYHRLRSARQQLLVRSRLVQRKNSRELSLV